MAQALTRSTRRLPATVAAAAAAVALLASAGPAQANFHYTKQGAEKITRDFVSRHYTNTSFENVVAQCRPQGARQADSRYKYHRWVCVWYDRSDNYYGRVLIVGSDASSGSYYYKVLDAPRQL